MKRSPFTLIVLVVIDVLIAVQSVLGNIVAEQLKEWLGPWADYVLPAFLLITGIVIGFTVREQIADTSEQHNVQRDNGQAAQNRRAVVSPGSTPTARSIRPTTSALARVAPGCVRWYYSRMARWCWAVGSTPMVPLARVSPASTPPAAPSFTSS